MACHQVVSRAAVRLTELNLNMSLKTSDLGARQSPAGRSLTGRHSDRTACSLQTILYPGVGGVMAVRLVVTITAAPGKGSELAQAYRARCEECMKEPGCEQFEIFQRALNPDTLTLLGRSADQAALDTHAKLQATRPALNPQLRVGSGEREDYEYNRTR